ncbi:hypothetical protein DFAR_150019 [Desulfarculales bacterium]
MGRDRLQYYNIFSIVSAAKSPPGRGRKTNVQNLRGVSALALLDRYGAVVDVIEADGFKVDARVHNDHGQEHGPGVYGVTQWLRWTTTSRPWPQPSPRPT